MAKKRTRVLLPGGIQGLVHDLQTGRSDNQPQPMDGASDEQGGAEKEKGAGPQPGQGGRTAEDQPSPTPPAQPGAPSAQATPPPHQSAAPSAQSSTAAPPQAAPQGGAAVAPPEDLAHGSMAAEHFVYMAGPMPADRLPDDMLHTPQDPADQTPQAHTAGRGRRPKQNTMKEYRIVKDDSRDSWQLFLDMAQQYKSGGGKLATIYIDESLKNVLDRMKYAGPERLPTAAILSSIVARFIYDHEADIKRALFSGDLL